MPTPGTVKSFNGRYGFLTSEEVQGDVMFTRQELPEDAREVSTPVLVGRPVQFEWVLAPDGRAKASAVSLPLTDGFPLPGKIKAFFEAKGYGFVTSSSLEGMDARFESDRLPPLAPGAQIQGELVTFEPHTMPNGMLRVAHMAFQREPAVAQAGGQITSQVVADALGAAGLGGTLSVLGRNGLEALVGRVAGILQGRMAGGAAPAAMASQGGQVRTGRVKNFKEGSRYGFIVSPGLPGDLKFSVNDLVSGPVENGSAVEFVPVGFPDGRLQAKQVRPAHGGAASPAVTALASGEVRTGQVKNFRETSGYGFIVCPDVQGDLKFTNADVESGSVENGSAVEFVVAVLPDGRLQAKHVHVVQGSPVPPAGSSTIGVEVHTGQVKNINETRGYGFIVCPGVQGDLKFSINDLLSGPVENGSVVEFVPAMLPDGRLQAKQVNVVQGGVAPPAGLSALADGEVRTGQVKNFRESSGYGFIICEGVPGDLKFSINDILSGPVENGSMVDFVPAVLIDGRLQAKQVRPALDGAVPPASSNAVADGAVADGEVRTGQVKNFRETSRYGFIVCPGLQGDLKFSVNDLVSGPIENGSTVEFLPVVLPDGRLQAKQVCAVQGVGQKRPAMAMDGARSADGGAIKRLATAPGAAPARWIRPGL